jgi:hypothetical protein
MRLARLEGTQWRSRRYVTAGQKQYGIDIYSPMPSGRYTTYQCRRYEEPSDFTEAVDEFLVRKWAACLPRHPAWSRAKRCISGGKGSQPRVAATANGVAGRGAVLAWPLRFLTHRCTQGRPSAASGVGRRSGRARLPPG